MEDEQDTTIGPLTDSASPPNEMPSVPSSPEDETSDTIQVTPLHEQATAEAPSHEDETPAATPVAASMPPAPPIIQQEEPVEETMQSLLDSPGNALRELNRGDVIEGIVARIDQDEILVDIGMKSEGVIPSRELSASGEPAPLIELSQRLLVYVMQPESPEGHAILSLKRARMEQSWRKAEELMNADQTVEAEVIDFNKGGLIVDLGVRGFVPISQIPELRGLSKGPEGESSEVTDRLAAMKGRRLPLKIIELNRSRNRLILSERQALQQMRASRKDDLLNELEPGQVRRGRVTSLCSFGAFVDLGGADGLVHISQLSYSRVNHPSEVLRVGDEVDVAVLSIDPQTKKIALSLKKALPDPWTLVEQRYQVGQLVEGTITKLAKFGAFAKIDDGIEGLIHLSELSDTPVENARDAVSEGDQVTLRVININSQRRRLGLSLRQVAHPDLPGTGEFSPEDEGDEEENDPEAAPFMRSPDDTSQVAESQSTASEPALTDASDDGEVVSPSVADAPADVTRLENQELTSALPASSAPTDHSFGPE